MLPRRGGKRDNVEEWSTTRIMYSTGLLMLVMAVTSAEALALVGHSHHMKRQQPNLPLLTLDVEPTHGIDTSHKDPEVPLHRFPVDSGRFNFTCTIKHPSHRYKLTVMREQQLNDGKSISIDFIDPSDYILNPVYNNGRTRIDFSEPNFIDSSAQFIRISLIIENLKVEDTGIYICKYGSIIKKISAVIYRVPKEEDVVLSSSASQLRVGQPSTITCTVTNVYPKPTVQLTHSRRTTVQNSVEVKDVSVVADPLNPNHLYNTTATFEFTPTWEDFEQKFTCLVHVQGYSNKTVDQVHQFDIQGTQIIDKNCEKAVAPKLGENEIRVSCEFFSNPRSESSYWEFEETVIETPATPSQDDLDAPHTDATSGSGSGDEQSAAGNNVVNELKPGSGDAAASATIKRKVKLIENEENSNYIYKVESTGNPVVHTAVLTIRSIGADVFKEYTFNAGNGVSKVIKVFPDETQKEISLKAEISSARALVASQSHSIVLCILSLFVMMIAQAYLG